MMKAGIMEAADIFAINKADTGGADILKGNLEVVLAMKAQLAGDWLPSVVLTEAIYDKGTDVLAQEIMRHREFLVTAGKAPEGQGETGADGDGGRLPQGSHPRYRPG
jgi:LAO/AO transport system kinase